MKQLSKALAVFINLVNYCAGIYVALTLVLKRDFTSIFYINGMTTNESLFFNMLLFVAGLALLGVVLLMLTREYKKPELVIEFPLIFEAVPVIASIIGVVYALGADTAREKIFVIIMSVLYSLLSLVIIYAGSAVFQIFPKETDSNQ